MVGCVRLLADYWMSISFQTRHVSLHERRGTCLGALCGAERQRKKEERAFSFIEHGESRTHFFMEPLDSEYVVQRQENPRARFNWLLIVPILGGLWLLFLLLAVIFQWSITSLVDPILGLMILAFLVLAGLLFWAFAPKANRV